jgi:hypothetical protein
MAQDDRPPTAGEKGKGKLVDAREQSSKTSDMAKGLKDDKPKPNGKGDGPQKEGERSLKAKHCLLAWVE